MQTPDDKLDLDSISFDDMIGEGLSSLPDIEDVEEFEEEPQEEFEEEFEENEAEYSDETEDETFEEEEEEDDYEEGDEDEEPLEGNSVAAEIAKTLGFEMDNEYADTVEGLTEFAKDVAQDVAEEQLESLFQQYPEVQKHLDYVMSGGDSDKFFEAHNPTTDYNNFNLTEKDLGSQRAILNQYFQLKGHDNRTKSNAGKSSRRKLTVLGGSCRHYRIW